MRLIIALLLLSLPATALARVRPRKHRPVHFLAECSVQVVRRGVHPAGWHVVRVKRAGRVTEAFLRRSGQPMMVVHYRPMGSRVAGWTVVHVHAPAAIGQWLSRHPRCRAVVLYQQAHTLPGAARNWVAARSMCEGEADLAIGGNVHRIKKWRCGDEAVTPIRIDGYAPTMTFGRER